MWSHVASHGGAHFRVSSCATTWRAGHSPLWPASGSTELTAASAASLPFGSTHRQYTTVSIVPLSRARPLQAMARSAPRKKAFDIGAAYQPLATDQHVSRIHLGSLSRHFERVRESGVPHISGETRFQVNPNAIVLEVSLLDVCGPPGAMHGLFGCVSRLHRLVDCRRVAEFNHMYTLGGRLQFSPRAFVLLSLGQDERVVFALAVLVRALPSGCCSARQLASGRPPALREAGALFPEGPDCGAAPLPPPRDW
jgi:hypothetical protein